MRPSYATGTPLQLTAIPAAGDTFMKWKSSLAALNGSVNAAESISMFANVEATALFQTTLTKSLDTPPSMVLAPSGNGAWYGQSKTSHDGLDSAVSPSLGPGQSSRVTTQVTGPGTLSFWWKVSSRVNSGRLTLLIGHFAQTTPAPISGTTGDWAQVTVAIPAGTHPIAWRYARDSNPLTDGENRGYVDEVKFVPEGVEENNFESWRINQFTESERANSSISGPGGDPDADGFSNLMEAAIGTSPKSRDSRALL